jgi:hypothetical protein
MNDIVFTEEFLISSIFYVVVIGGVAAWIRGVIQLLKAYKQSKIFEEKWGIYIMETNRYRGFWAINAEAKAFRAATPECEAEYQTLNKRSLSIVFQVWGIWATLFALLCVTMLILVSLGIGVV